MPHVHDRFERFFSTHLLLAVNLAIIASAQIFGGGRLFYESGLIHVPVTLFVLLAAARLFGRYYLYDPVLRSFLRACLAALAVLLISHTVEFAAQNLDLPWSHAATFSAVVAFHIMSVLVLAYGTIHVLTAYRALPASFDWIPGILFVGVSVYVATLALEHGLSGGVPPFSYVLLAMGVCAVEVAALMKLASAAPALKEFSRAMIAAVVLIGAAAVMDTFHLVAIGSPFLERQSTYMSHFAFYAAVSMMFLAFGRLQRLGGVYAELRQEAEREAGGGARRAAAPRKPRKKPPAPPSSNMTLPPAAGM